MSYFEPQTSETASSQPRAVGTFAMTAKRTDQGTRIDTFRTSGSMKALFPHGDALEAIMINTSGGLTGGDRFATDVGAGPGCDVVLTTQAAERAYRSVTGTARVETRLTVANGARICCLPQELIVFEGSALKRRLRVDLADTARLLMVEPVIFGRQAMGETLGRIALQDEIDITRANRPLYLDRIRIEGDAERKLSANAIAPGAKAMVNVVFIAPEAEARLPQVRALLPATGGASLLAPDMLVLRLLAQDGFLLRRALVPILELLKGSALPRSWSL
ncbi:MAG: urease accessory protein UreD [Paracoccaceae bacterium]|nr:urease accessory protein UreD [Paracoccaceae bacterium]